MTSSLPLRPLLCGALAVFACASAPVAHAASPIENYALAISWEPAFCLTRTSGKPECAERDAQPARRARVLAARPVAAERLVLRRDRGAEGQRPGRQLVAAAGRRRWQPADRGRACRWRSPARMSSLERHEWIEHGTCSGLSQQNFFAPTLAMLNGINASNLGSTVSRQRRRPRDAGPAAGRRGARLRHLREDRHRVPVHQLGRQVVPGGGALPHAPARARCRRPCSRRTWPSRSSRRRRASCARAARRSTSRP